MNMCGILLAPGISLAFFGFVKGLGGRAGGWGVRVCLGWGLGWVIGLV